jgi:putative FmdB family regulatory protein
MPTYKYECSQCVIKVTLSHGINETEEPRYCPGCEGKLIRLYQFSGVSFNGDGFYSNDKKSRLDIG